MNNKIDNEAFKLQFITNQWSNHEIEYQVQKACESGCKWIQLRLKEVSHNTWEELGPKIKAICLKYNSKLIINDHVEMALKLNADGVHLGKEDMAPEKAKQILGDDKIIGVTANTLKDILSAYEDGADYIGLGPFRHTQTKQKLSPVLGLEGYIQILEELNNRKINIPVVGIGGIELSDISDLLKTGLSGIAVSSLISHHKNPEEVTFNILETLKKITYHAENSR